MAKQLSLKQLDMMSEDNLRKYLGKLTIDKIPKGNSKFKCSKHNCILPYLDIVAGCWWCIEDEARAEQDRDSDES